LSPVPALHPPPPSCLRLRPALSLSLSLSFQLSSRPFRVNDNTTINNTTNNINNNTHGVCGGCVPKSVTAAIARVIIASKTHVQGQRLLSQQLHLDNDQAERRPSAVVTMTHTLAPLSLDDDDDDDDDGALSARPVDDYSSSLKMAATSAPRKPRSIRASDVTGAGRW